MNEELKQYEQDLFKKYQAGTPGAKRDLLKSLAPVINSQAGRFSGSGLPDIAVKLEGQRLALEAFKTYDPSKSQLNTHVTNSLKKLSRFVTNYQNVGHIPEPRALMIGKYNVI